MIRLGSRARRGPVVAIIVIALCSGCVLPARSYAAYEGKAVQSAKETRSAVGTALLAATQAARGKLTQSVASVLMSNAEADANTAQSSFASVQPPSHAADRLRSELDDIQTNVVSTISGLRIETRRGHLRELATSTDDLRQLAAQLDTFVRVHR